MDELQYQGLDELNNLQPPPMFEDAAEYLDESQDSDDEMKDELIQRQQLVYEKPITSKASNFFNMRDPFTFNSAEEKADNRRYKTLMDARVDMFRVLRIIGKNDIFILKENDGKLNITFYAESKAKAKLSNITLWYEKGSKVTLWDAVERFGRSTFKVSRSTLYSMDEDVFSLFSGYSVQTGPSVIELLPFVFDKLVFEGISDSNHTIYNYILNWIAYLTQRPGQKTEVCLILTGVEGTGKSLFGDTVCRMLSPFAEENLDMSDIMGKFNSIIVGKILLVVNEVDTVGSVKAAEKLMNKIKRLITDATITIEEKYVSKMTTENSANLIMISNSPAPVILSLTDRRYFVTRVNAKFLRKKHVFTSLAKAREHKSFYPHLLTFFLSRDINTFNPRIIPMTKAKKELTVATMADVDLFIQRHFKNLISPRGFDMKDLHASIPKKHRGDEMFILHLRSRCFSRRLGTDPSRFRTFFLRPEYIDRFKQLQ